LTLNFESDPGSRSDNWGNKENMKFCHHFLHFKRAQFQCSGSAPGSGSFHQQAKKLRNNLIFSFLWLLYDFFSLKNDVNVPSKMKKHKNLEKKNILVGTLKVTDEKSRIRIR